MNVLFAASECVPFCKTGGLADVIGELPEALRPILPGKKPNLITFLPKYSAIDEKTFKLERIPGKIRIPVGGKMEEGEVFRSAAKPGTAYFIQNARFFDRAGIYGSRGKDFEDNDARFSFFCRAVLEFAKLIGFVPDIIHCHDWQTGLVPAYLKTLYAQDSFFKATSTLFTIHNLAYQGIFPKRSLAVAGLGWNTFTPEFLEYYDQVCFLKSGLTFSDRLTTVSPGYAREIQSGNKFGFGMEGVLKSRSEDLTGILNGLDQKTWDPAKDPHLKAHFSVRSKNVPDQKRICKRDLQQAARLREDPDAPMIGMVSRLDPQKGFKSMTAILPKVMAENSNARWVILGSGSPAIEKDLAGLARRFPARFSFVKGFDDPLARKIYAGSDLFFMPSEFEPCGLGQMIAMKYGAIPVVTPTGGLADTVSSWDPETQTGNGFVSGEISSASVHQALTKALSALKDPAQWKVLLKNAMSADFSWKRSANRYLSVYEETLAQKPCPVMK